MIANEKNNEVSTRIECSEYVGVLRLDAAVCGPRLWSGGACFVSTESFQTGPRTIIISFKQFRVALIIGFVVPILHEDVRDSV